MESTGKYWIPVFNVLEKTNNSVMHLEEIEREIHPVDRVFDITNAQAELDARKENGYGY